MATTRLGPGGFPGKPTTFTAKTALIVPERFVYVDPTTGRLVRSQMRHLSLIDGITEPSAQTGYLLIYVDAADGALKSIDGDGNVVDLTGGGTLTPVTVTASENLSAGDLVNIWDDGGTAKARKADASAGYKADGYVTAAVTSGNSASVSITGTNDAVSGLSPGQTLYLSATAGGVTTTAPTTSGYLAQTVGVAVSATSMVFQPQISILLN